METIASCLAANIRLLRKERKLTQAELASRAGISTIFLHGIEAQRKWISPTTIKAIAKALQIPETQLFESRVKAKRRQTIRRLKNPKFDHIPDDIFNALATTCRDSEWKWDALRWLFSRHQHLTVD